MSVDRNIFVVKDNGIGAIRANRAIRDLQGFCLNLSDKDNTVRLTIDTVYDYN